MHRKHPELSPSLSGKATDVIFINHQLQTIHIQNGESFLVFEVWDIFFPQLLRLVWSTPWISDERQHGQIFYRGTIKAIAVAWSAYNKFCMDRVVIMTTYRDRVSLLTHTLMYSIQKTVTKHLNDMNLIFSVHKFNGR